jgi:hypothetical protein
MTGSRGRVLRAAARLVTDENLDLYLLAVAALTFTVLGFLGATDIEALASVILALLALLALSQVRSRRHVAAIAAVQRADPLALFLTALPEELASLRSTASSFLFIGESMVRTVQSGRADIRRLLQAGRKVRVLLLDPDDDELLRVADRLRESLLAGRIRGTLEELAFLRGSAHGQLEVRVCSFVPRAAIYALNLGEPDGVVFVQHYEHRPVGDSAPVFRLNASDGFWYQHFAAEAARMWDDGTPWPAGTGTRLTRIPRPLFADAFGPGLEESITHAAELLITGVTRNTLVNSYYGKFEELLSAGCQIRFVLTDPDSDAIAVAADRYYAERSADSVRARARHTLRLLAELKNSTEGAISVRLSPHPAATGIIAVDSQAAATSAIFVEYYSYQARGEQPKFVLQPSDGRWFAHFAAEAEKLWTSANPHALTHPEKG